MDLSVLAGGPTSRGRHVPQAGGTEILPDGGQGQLHRLPYRLWRHIGLVSRPPGRFMSDLLNTVLTITRIYRVDNKYGIFSGNALTYSHRRKQKMDIV